MELFRVQLICYDNDNFWISQCEKNRNISKIYFPSNLVNMQIL